MAFLLVFFGRFLSDTVGFVCTLNQVAPPISKFINYSADYDITFSTTRSKSYVWIICINIQLKLIDGCSSINFAFDMWFNYGISVEKPSKTCWMFAMLGYSYQAEDHSVSSHFLLPVLEETRAFESERWSVSLPRVPNTNLHSRRKQFRSATDQLLSHQSAQHFRCSTKRQWTWGQVWDLWEKERRMHLLFWLREADV